MNNQSDNNKMGSWLKIIVLGVGAAGAIYGAVRYMLGQQGSAHANCRGPSRNSTRRSLPQSSNSRECQICSETSDELVVFLPCMHTVACLDCAARMRKCVICKSAIVERIAEESSKKVTYISPKSNDDLMCSICYDNKKRIILNCGHTFCKVCVFKINECPVCRESITSRNNFF